MENAANNPTLHKEISLFATKSAAQLCLYTSMIFLIKHRIIMTIMFTHSLTTASNNTSRTAFSALTMLTGLQEKQMVCK